MLAIRRASALLAITILTVGAASRALALDIPIEDPEIKACVARSLPEKAMTQKLTLKLFNAGELINTTQAELFWKKADNGRSRVMVRMTAPPARAGIAVLAIERESGDPDLAVYMPDARKARKVAGRTIDASMFGTDFSYEDFAYFQGVAAGSKITRLADEELAGAANYVLEALPGADGSKYSRIVSYINREQCVLTKIDFFAKNGTLLKDLTLPREDVQQIGERWVPKRAILNDHKHDSRTEVVIDDIKIDPEISETLFSMTKFGAGR
jgi:Outer membrane lipoprotein-sorting protein